MENSTALFGDPQLNARFWAKVRQEPGGCWVWTANKTNGYGRVRFNGKLHVAHVLLYTTLVGPVAEGDNLDHLCHTTDRSCSGGLTCPHRACVRLDHLEAVSAYENTMRGMSIQARNSRKTHCVRGHEFTPANTRIETTGSRRCRRCKNDEGTRYQAKRRALLRAS